MTAVLCPTSSKKLSVVFIRNNMPNKLLKKALIKIKKANKIFLVTHDRPDGDAVSSICALSELLIQLDKQFFAFCQDLPPSVYSFLPHSEIISDDRKKIKFSEYDLIIALDCGSLARTNITSYIKNKKPEQYVIEFDHHPKIDDYANLEIRDSQASSTAEILYSFFKENKIKINKNIANCLLTGIMTDTGNLLYNSTSDKTVKISSELLLYGAKFPTILENTWRNKTLAGMKLWGRAIQNLKINKKYNFAYTVLTYQELSNEMVAEEELEGLSGFLSSLYGVKALLVLREEKPDFFKGSLRTSRDDIDVSKLAIKLGGGGHIRASGFKIFGKLTKTSTGWNIK